MQPINVKEWRRSISSLSCLSRILCVHQQSVILDSQRLRRIELFTKFLKEGENRGFDPSLRVFSIKSSLACCVLEPTLIIG